MNQSISAAVRRLDGWVLYSPPFQAGSFRMASMVIRRQARFRPEIWVGKLANGISASMKSGCISPQSQVCIPPIDVSHDQSRVIDAKAVGQQSILRFDHVDIPVARKLCVQSITRLA